MHAPERPTIERARTPQSSYLAHELLHAIKLRAERRQVALWRGGRAEKAQHVAIHAKEQLAAPRRRDQRLATARGQPAHQQQRKQPR